MYLLINFENIYHDYSKSLSDDVNSQFSLKYQTIEHFILRESKKLHHKIIIIEHIKIQHEETKC